MHDLNDLYFFVEVVKHGGFAPAGRALNIPKSRLSRRIAQLEERLGVRLIQRSTRTFAVTELGQEYYDQCLAMLAGAEARAGKRASAFTFRGVAPAFDDRPLQVCGQDGDPMRVWTAQDGRRAMTGEARWDAQP